MTYDAGGSYVVSRTDYTGIYYVTTYSKGPVLLVCRRTGGRVSGQFLAVRRRDALLV